MAPLLGQTLRATVIAMGVQMMLPYSHAQVSKCGTTFNEPCYVAQVDIDSGCNTDTVGACQGFPSGLSCFSSSSTITNGKDCGAGEGSDCKCFEGICFALGSGLCKNPKTAVDSS